MSILVAFAKIQHWILNLGEMTKVG